MSNPPDWGPDWADVRALWSIDPDIAYLNNGAFGAAPLPVLAEQQRLRAELEREPFDFLIRTYGDRIAVARAEIAAFLRADPAGLVFVPNATTGVATCVKSLDLKPGDQLVTTTHVYGAVRNGLRRHAERFGAEVIEVDLSLPTTPDADLAAPILDAVTERTRLVIVDWITSPTALVLPIAEIVRGCHARGVRVVVDAAHAPGQLDVDLIALDADAVTGNLHKWAGAPKGAAVLVIREDWRPEVRPLVTSWGDGEGLHAEFDWIGTHDPTAWLAAPTGIATLGALGWDRLRAYQHDLALWGAARVADALGNVPLLHDAPGFHAAMAIVDPGPLDADQAKVVENGLRYDHAVDVPVLTVPGRFFVRVSAQAYNRADDYERLARALPEVLARVR